MGGGIPSSTLDPSMQIESFEKKQLSHSVLTILVKDTLFSN